MQLSISEFKIPFEAKLDEDNGGVDSRPSLLVSIRKRIDSDVFESLTDDLIRKGLKLKVWAKPDDLSTEIKDDDGDDHDPHSGNNGKLND